MKDVIGFVKNFDIKVPHKESFDYYVDTLSKSYEYSDLREKVSLWEDYEKSLGEMSVKEHKGKVISELVSHFKDLVGESVNNYSDTLQYSLHKESFRPEDGRFYISFDVRQGNWSVIRKSINKNLPDWEKYLTDELGVHPVLAKSKGMRQAILGQACNPKRYTKILKFFTWRLLDEISMTALDMKVVGINDEEIHILLGDNLDLINEFDAKFAKIEERMKEWGLPVKKTLFRVNFVENFGNHVRVDSFYDYDSREFKYKRLWGNGGDGNRFYLHFKTLILEEKVDVRDLLIKKDNLYFQWCGPQYHDITEYSWVERWLKPLVESYASDEVSYYTSDGVKFATYKKEAITSNHRVDYLIYKTWREYENFNEADKSIREEYVRFVKSLFIIHNGNYN